MATNVLLFLFLSWVANLRKQKQKNIVHQRYKYTGCTSMQRCRKKYTEISIKQLTLTKYYRLITTVKILSMHTSNKHQSWRDPLWTNHTKRQVNSSLLHQVHRIGTFFILQSTPVNTGRLQHSSGLGN